MKPKLASITGSSAPSSNAIAVGDAGPGLKGERLSKESNDKVTKAAAWSPAGSEADRDDGAFVPSGSSSPTSCFREVANKSVPLTGARAERLLAWLNRVPQQDPWSTGSQKTMATMSSHAEQKTRFYNAERTKSNNDNDSVDPSDASSVKAVAGDHDLFGPFAMEGDFPLQDECAGVVETGTDRHMLRAVGDLFLEGEDR